MPDEEIGAFAEMWTTKQMDYGLLDLGNGRYSIVQLSTNMLVTIEENDIFENVIQKMISMGNRLFKISEYKTYRQQKK